MASSSLSDHRNMWQILSRDQILCLRHIEMPLKSYLIQSAMHWPTTHLANCQIGQGLADYFHSMEFTTEKAGLILKWQVCEYSSQLNLAWIEWYLVWTSRYCEYCVVVGDWMIFGLNIWLASQDSHKDCRLFAAHTLIFTSSKPIRTIFITALSTKFKG